MLSPADVAIIGAFALIFFGPDQLPKVARKVGQAVREVQSTSQAFIREMERAADIDEAPAFDPSYGKLAEPSPAPEPWSAVEHPALGAAEAGEMPAAAAPADEIPADHRPPPGTDFTI